MKWNRIRSSQFWISVGIFATVLFFSVWSFEFSEDANVNNASRIVIMVSVSFLCVVLEIRRDVPYIVEQIRILLSSVDTLKILDSDQNLRANLFCEKHIPKFCIVQSYNMEGDSDKDLEIPHNRGCTGQAWASRSQIWAEKDKFFDESAACALPPTEKEKVRRDLEWICSTPVVKKGQILAILNFDGNRVMSETQKASIMQHASKVAEGLGNLLGC